MFRCLRQNQTPIFFQCLVGLPRGRLLFQFKNFSDTWVGSASTLRRAVCSAVPIAFGRWGGRLNGSAHYNPYSLFGHFGPDAPYFVSET